MSGSPRRLPLALALLGVVCAVLVLVLDAGQPVRAVAGVPLVLALPGTALSFCLWPHGRVNGAERTALSAGLSLALAALTTLALHAVGIALGTSSWAIALGGESLVAGLVATARAPGATPPHPGRRFRLLPVVLAVLAAGLVGGAGVVTGISASDQRDSVHFSQLWALHGPAGTLRLGVRNLEGSTQRYVVRAQRDGVGLRVWRDVVLSDGATWTTTWGPRAGSGKVLVTLNRAAFGPSVYRHVDVNVP